MWGTIVTSRFTNEKNQSRVFSNFLVDPACRIQNRDLSPGSSAPKPVPHATAWKVITAAHDRVRSSAGRRAFTVPGNGSGQASRRVQAQSWVLMKAQNREMPWHPKEIIPPCTATDMKRFISFKEGKNNCSLEPHVICLGAVPCNWSKSLSGSFIFYSIFWSLAMA